MVHSVYSQKHFIFLWINFFCNPKPTMNQPIRHKQSLAYTYMPLMCISFDEIDHVNNSITEYCTFQRKKTIIPLPQACIAHHQRLGLQAEVSGIAPMTGSEPGSGDWPISSNLSDIMRISQSPVTKKGGELSPNNLEVKTDLPLTSPIFNTKNLHRALFLPLFGGSSHCRSRHPSPREAFRDRIYWHIYKRAILSSVCC
ncbi:hypothetical protein LIPSTDRAFT_193043 [Lipomyces starkeyi NRRL Y-11557]|uniref:Uncharacterized protein n=1 Tax=Lipomyces starkeyi NRRL Y-11557 TaxID=675824 RepID=A0A1E3PW91_LIPST|nr:hypothetical protein LIPSTDRAFT_193043 [Lipomyces starkeyi NRRL Y-11557]